MRATPSLPTAPLRSVHALMHRTEVEEATSSAENLAAGYSWTFRSHFRAYLINSRSCQLSGRQADMPALPPSLAPSYLTMYGTPHLLPVCTLMRKQSRSRTHLKKQMMQP